MYKALLICFAFFCLIVKAHGSDQLLYFEAQSITGYSSERNRAIFYSMNPDAEMQKPSLGFDYVKRFSGEFGDVATLALQGRLALTVDAERGNDVSLQPQFYNAYLKVKTPGPYVWIGHNRPAFGLSSYFDSHGLLLRTLAIQGFGYDRDWGVGMNKDFSWGDISASATSGSGMPLYLRDNFMLAARGSYGVLSRDNMSGGFSVGYGQTLETMGYKTLDPEPRRMALAGADFALLRNNFEHRIDVLGGKWLGEETYAFSYRLGIHLGQESRLKIEGQPMFWTTGGNKNYQLSAGLSYAVTPDLTTRLAYTYDHDVKDNMVVLQLYYYKPVSWLNTFFGEKKPVQ
jgi:hypothetical protein